MKTKEKNNFKLYKVVIGYYDENKQDPPRSSGGQTQYFVTSLDKNNAKKIALKQFNKIHKDLLSKNVKINIDKTKEIKFPKNEGIVNLY